MLSTIFKQKVIGSIGTINAFRCWFRCLCTSSLHSISLSAELVPVRFKFFAAIIKSFWACFKVICLWIVPTALMTNSNNFFDTVNSNLTNITLIFLLGSFNIAVVTVTCALASVIRFTVDIGDTAVLVLKVKFECGATFIVFNSFVTVSISMPCGSSETSSIHVAWTYTSPDGSILHIWLVTFFI